MKRFDLSQRAAEMRERFGRERWNEHVKLLASGVNSLAVAFLIGAFVAPVVSAHRPAFWETLLLMAFAAGLGVAAQLVMSYYKGKE